MVSIEVAIIADRAASIRAGLNPEATSVQVDLDAITQVEPDLLADHDRPPVAVDLPTAEALFDVLRATEAAEQAKLAEILDAYTTTLQQRRTKSWQNHLKPSGTAYDVLAPDWPSVPMNDRGWSQTIAKHRDKDNAITESPDALTWRTTIDKANKHAQQQAWTRQQEQQEQEALEQRHAVERLRDWALEHGSERVQLLIEEDIPTWYGLAEDEYFTAHTPQGFAPLAEDETAHAVSVPTAEDIHALRAVRTIAETDPVFDQARLAAIATFSQAGRTFKHIAAGLTITAPHGAQHTVWRAVAKPSPPGETASP